jgi:hypothetical protein
MSYTIEELRGLSTEELIAAHDRRTDNVSWGVKDYLDEFGRRDARELSESIKDNTDRAAAEVSTLAALTHSAGVRMERLTWVIAALTAINVVVAPIAPL